jgi:hypothetical protein
MGPRKDIILALSLVCFFPDARLITCVYLLQVAKNWNSVLYGNIHNHLKAAEKSSNALQRLANQQERISSNTLFPAGAGIAMAQQLDNGIAMTAAVGNDGALYVSWAFGDGKWQGPVRTSPPITFPPGAAIAMAKQTNYRSYVVGGEAWNKQPPPPV